MPQNRLADSQFFSDLLSKDAAVKRYANPEVYDPAKMYITPPYVKMTDLGKYFALFTKLVAHTS
jgi:hypothetical protein